MSFSPSLIPLGVSLPWSLIPRGFNLPWSVIPRGVNLPQSVIPRGVQLPQSLKPLRQSPLDLILQGVRFLNLKVENLSKIKNILIPWSVVKVPEAKTFRLYLCYTLVWHSYT